MLSMSPGRADRKVWSAMSERDITKLKLRVDVWNDTPMDDPDGGIVTSGLDGKTELEPIVDADLKRFEEFYDKKLKNSLSKFEKAAIKTYLYWKTHPEID